MATPVTTAARRLLPRRGAAPRGLALRSFSAAGCPSAGQEPPPLPRVIAEETVFENAWLRLKTIRFLDARGRERRWTGLERTTTYPSAPDGPPPCDSAQATADAREGDEICDAVVVFPFLTRAHEPTRVVLIRQFRPPVGKWVLELPAGLIDAGESAEEAAARELREETGFLATRVLHVGPPMVNDQGITNGKCRLLLVQVRDEQQPAQRAQQLEEDEMIHVVLAPLDGLVPWLLERKAREGDAIDARLYSYALGLQALPVALAGDGAR